MRRASGVRPSTSRLSSIGTARLASLPATTSASASVMRPLNGFEERQQVAQHLRFAARRAGRGTGDRAGGRIGGGNRYGRLGGRVIGPRWCRIGDFQCAGVSAPSFGRTPYPVRRPSHRLRP